jgi:hypothetical protein
MKWVCSTLAVSVRLAQYLPIIQPVVEKCSLRPHLPGNLHAHLLLYLITPYIGQRFLQRFPPQCLNPTHRRQRSPLGPLILP